MMILAFQTVFRILHHLERNFNCQQQYSNPSFSNQTNPLSQTEINISNTSFFYQQNQLKQNLFPSQRLQTTKIPQIYISSQKNVEKETDGKQFKLDNDFQKNEGKKIKKPNRPKNYVTEKVFYQNHKLKEKQKSDKRILRKKQRKCMKIKFKIKLKGDHPGKSRKQKIIKTQKVKPIKKIQISSQQKQQIKYKSLVEGIKKNLTSSQANIPLKINFNRRQVDYYYLKKFNLNRRRILPQLF